MPNNSGRSKLGQVGSRACVELGKEKTANDVTNKKAKNKLNFKLVNITSHCTNESDYGRQLTRPTLVALDL